MKKNKILRVSSFAYHVGDKEYEFPTTPDTPYVVDDSSFVPISEAIKQLGNGYGSGNRLEQMYDFPDGKDTGAVIPFSRSAACKDIAELSSNISDNINNINNEVQKAQKMKEFQDNLNKDLSPAPSSE